MIFALLSTISLILGLVWWVFLIMIIMSWLISFKVINTRRRGAPPHDFPPAADLHLVPRPLVVVFSHHHHRELPDRLHLHQPPHPVRRPRLAHPHPDHGADPAPDPPRRPADRRPRPQ